MACWPATVAGSFSLVLLLFDLYYDKWNDLPHHAMFGIVFTGLFVFVCSFVNESVSGALLVVPALLFIVFAISIYVVGTSIRNRGCCLNCSPGPSPRPEPCPEPSPIPEPCPGPAPEPKPICTNPLELKATPLL